MKRRTEGGAGLESSFDEIAAVDQRHRTQVFRRNLALLRLHKIVVRQAAVARTAIEPMQFEMLIEFRHAEETLHFAFAHVRHVFESHVVGDESFHLFDDRGRITQARQYAVRDFHAFFDVTIETNAIGNAEGRGLADIVQEYAQREVYRRLTQAFEHDEGVNPDVAFGMKFRRLFHAFERRHFGQDFVQQAGGIEELEAATRAAFDEDTRNFIAHTFNGNGSDGGREFLHGSES